jgi:hypothetical protein
MEKIYHIYIQNKCVFHSLNEKEFQNIWKIISSLKESSYEELFTDKEVILNSSY